MKKLKGLKILGLYICEDSEILVFHTNEGLRGYRLEGECCSTSWFNDVIGVEALVNATVQEVESINMDYVDSDEYEEVKSYGYKIKTDRGYADIIFRNGSNGYYGARMYTCEPYIDSGYKKITQDWTA
jgi:hypothetical protein